MQAVILAAGMGKRLKELTKDNAKCMVKVNGVTLIERMLRQLDGRGLSSIIIVTGYQGRKLKEYVVSLKINTKIIFIDNPQYSQTNNIYSLSLAKAYLLEEDTLLFESDIIFENEVLDCLINDTRDTLVLADRYESWMDGTCIRMDENDRIIDFISGEKFDFNNIQGCYKTVNIYKFSRHFSRLQYVPFLEAYQSAFGQNEYYEQVLRVITVFDNAMIQGKRLEGRKWYEIDDAQDLDIASVLFCTDADKMVTCMEQRYGGYWRFPNMLDYCYLVNPYYPPQKMADEIKASFEKLLMQYPSGMGVNSMLAEKYFDMRSGCMAVGNGAAELIKSLMDDLEGNTGFIYPTFEEYPNRCKGGGGDSVIFMPENENFAYTADDVMEYFGKHNVCSLILINPDNPTGNYIPKADMLRIINWSRQKGITLIVDESFADFSDERDNSLMRQSLLEDNPNVVVIKSISKSFGVPGIRLGVLVSGNRELVSRLKQSLSIWNINSFAEFFLQILEKYKKDYEEGMAQFREERNRFMKKLIQIEGIRPVSSQADFIMIELLKKITARELTKQLLLKYHILVKDLSAKLPEKQYIRTAIRKKQENDKLLLALEEILRNAV